MEIKNSKELGELIKIKRKELGITQSELAFTTQLSTRLIVGLETNKRSVGIDKLLKICSALNLKVNIE